MVYDSYKETFEIIQDRIIKLESLDLNHFAGQTRTF